MVISISIHALLAESDKVVIPGPPIMIPISIHALLAESDFRGWTLNINGPIFLSTLSLRRATQVFQRIAKPFRISIHALLAESDRYLINAYHRIFGISIHALLAESDPSSTRRLTNMMISIHALLAESDSLTPARISSRLDFYPRSPCGERQALGLLGWLRVLISIHALLAESDGECR